MVMEKREQIGKLFVKLTAKIYGGDIQANGVNDCLVGNPDIIHWEKNQAYESKSSISSDHHKISPGQIEHYRNLINTDFPLTQGEVYYFFWQHKKRGVSRFDGNDLEREVVSNINGLLIVSFDVIEAGTKVWETTGENSWGETYMFRCRERKALTYESEGELTRMGLDSKNYFVRGETIPLGTYKHKWWEMPEFLVTEVVRKGLRGVERVKR